MDAGHLDLKLKQFQAVLFIKTLQVGVHYLSQKRKKIKLQRIQEIICFMHNVIHFQKNKYSKGVKNELESKISWDGSCCYCINSFDFGN